MAGTLGPLVSPQLLKGLELRSIPWAVSHIYVTNLPKNLWKIKSDKLPWLADPNIHGHVIFDKYDMAEK